MKILVTQLCPALLQTHGLWPATLLCPWDSSGKNTGVSLSCPSQGNLPNPGIKPMSLTSPALAGGLFTSSATWEALFWSPLQTLISNKNQRMDLCITCTYYTACHWDCIPTASASRPSHFPSQRSGPLQRLTPWGCTEHHWEWFPRLELFWQK